MSKTLRDALAREAVEAEARADAEERGDVDPRPGQRAAPPTAATAVYSIRLPVERIEALRTLAERDGQPPTALMRAWVLDRLAQEQAPAGSRDAVDQLMQAIRRSVEQELAKLSSEGFRTQAS